ncbi:hypothetical protein NLU13_4298 [Sarocladium strictum]|uniref:Uncharacterized protein n=1 Tax=Sarocladium strictum TaxID=5046 RepID=A0AA39L8S4_SARSR|nr:hypothetical protein NLU13_4298 [Sarocladium strictum]
MILSNLLPVAATSLLFACSAFADKNYGEECTLTTCWASFNLECEEGPWYCSFNDSNSYPEFDRGDQHDPRLVIIDDDIEIEWRDQDKSHPVRVSWHWWAENDTDSTDELVDITGDDSTTIINFWKIIQDEFPNNHTNLTSWEVLGWLQNNDTDMVFAIYQPESPKYTQIQDEWNAEPGEHHLLDYSNSFKLSQYNGKWDSVRRYMNAQYSRGRKSVVGKWRMGVGIGVGVGVPLVTLIALLGGYILGKRAGTSNLRPISDNTSS